MSPLLFGLHSDGGKSKSWLGTNGSPQREDPQQRLRWQAHLEFTHNHTVGDLTWDLIDPVLARSERLHTLVLGGIPHSMRPQVSGETLARLLISVIYNKTTTQNWIFVRSSALDASVWSAAEETDL